MNDREALNECSEVLTAVTLKITVFLNVMLYSWAHRYYISSKPVVSIFWVKEWEDCK